MCTVLYDGKTTQTLLSVNSKQMIQFHLESSGFWGWDEREWWINYLWLRIEE